MAGARGRRPRKGWGWSAATICVILLVQVAVGLWLVIEPVHLLSIEAAKRGKLDLFPPLRGLSSGDDALLIVLVIGAGLLGSFIHAATSFASYVGNRKFEAQWTLWYVFRGLIGVSLALFIYLAIRGGLLSGGAGEDAINPYGVAALGGLAGLFAKQAVDKFEEVFETVFRTATDDRRKDKLRDPALKITTIDPEQLPVGSPVRSVKLTVPNAQEGIRAKVGDRSVEPTSVSGDTVVVPLVFADLATARTIPILVEADGVTPSEAVLLTIVPPDNGDNGDDGDDGDGDGAAGPPGPAVPGPDVPIVPVPGVPVVPVPPGGPEVGAVGDQGPQVDAGAVVDDVEVVDAQPPARPAQGEVGGATDIEDDDDAEAEPALDIEDDDDAEAEPALDVEGVGDGEGEGDGEVGPAPDVEVEGDGEEDEGDGEVEPALGVMGVEGEGGVEEESVDEAGADETDETDETDD